MASTSSSHIETTSSNVGAMINIQGAGTSNTHIEKIIVGGAEKAIQINEFNVPRLIQTYKGREKEAEELTSLFFEKGNKKVVICGLSGFGKSELAKQFAKHCKKSGKIEKIIWINAEKKEDLEQSFQKLSESAGISNLSGNSLVHYIYEQSEHFVKHKCMFIMDNGLNRQCIVDYEPPDTDNYFLLVTSREKDWGDDVMSFQLNPLTDNSALEVIQSVLTVNYKKEDHELYKQLADIVGNVPLGLQVVAAYVREGIKAEGEGFCLKEYVEEMKTSQEKYTNKIPLNVVNTYQQSLYGAIRISLNKLKNEVNKAKDLALNLLFVCSYLNADYIYFSDLLKISSSILLTKSKYCHKQLMFALRLVDNYSFISYKPGQIEINIHRIIQEILLFHLREYDSETQSKCYTICLEFLLPDKFLHITDILKHSDYNLKTFYMFYKQNDYFLRNENYIDLRILDLTQTEKNTSSLISYKTGLKVFIETLINTKCTKSLKLILNDYDEISKSNLLKNIITNRELQWNVISLMSLIEVHDDFNSDDVINILDLLNCLEIMVTKNDNGETVLHVVAASFYADLIQLLVTKYQIDINMQDFLGKTPLHTFFSKTVNINTRTSSAVDYFLMSRSTGLRKKFRRITTTQRAVATAKQLIRSGASLDIKDSNDMTPLEFAINLKQYEFVELFLHEIEDKQFLQNALENIGDFKYINKRNLLHMAISQNKINILKLFLQYNVDINNIDGDDNTPMHAAAQKWNLEALDILTQHSPDVNASNVYGNTPLIEFCLGVRYRLDINIDEVDKTLDILKCKENKTITNKFGETVLHILVSTCNADLVHLLLTKYQMNANALDSGDRSPLHTMLYEEFVLVHFHRKKDEVIRTVQELQRYGARLDFKDYSGKTPVQVARERNLIELLQAGGFIIN